MPKKSSIPKEVLDQVREACKHYDKPKRIGKLPLATVALQSVLLENPDHPTGLTGRGEALQRVIDVNLDKLEVEPSERDTPEGKIYLCLYCYTYERDPYDGTQIGKVGAFLEARYKIPIQTGQYRITKEGIPLLSYHMSYYLAEHAWVETTPNTPNFVGREAQLAYYHQQLEQNGLAVIQGAGGIGKTALAAELVKRETEQPVCWITIRPGLNDSVSGVLYGWAAFLAKNGYPQLWGFMRGTASEEKKVTDFFPHLLVGFGEIKPLLCLDNLEVISKSQRDFWTLLSMVQEQSQATLLLTSQQRPPLPGLNRYSKLDGLTTSEVEQLIKPIKLTGEQLEALTLYSSGNPRLINLWLAHMRVQAFDPVRLFRLESEFTSNFLLTQIINALNEGQQRAALLLALSRRPLNGFLLQSSSKQLRPLSDLEIESDDFTALQRLGILSESANQWTVLPLLKEHLAEQGMILSFADEIIDFHQWLSEFYTLQGNTIEAAYHAIEGGRQEQAFLSLARQQHLLIEQGQAGAMSDLLANISPDDLSKPRRKVLRELRIKLWQLLGNYGAAEAEAQAAIDEASTARDKASGERIIGKIAGNQGHVSQARNHYREGLRLLSIQDATLEALLRGELAWTLMEQNDLEEAWEEAERAQMTLQNIFGNIADLRGDLNLAIEHFQKGMAIGEEKGERRLLTRIYNNLALAYWKKGQFKEAIATFEANLKVIEEIGELVGKAITLLNIGLCYTQIGLDKPEKAIDYFAQALPTFTTLGDVRGEMLAHLNLGEQYLRIGEVDMAHKYVYAAIQVDKKEAQTFDYADAQRIYAEILLAQDKPGEALTMAKQALNDLRVPNATTDSPDAFSDPFYAKLTCETLSKIHKALGEWAEAERYRSLRKELEEKMKS